VSSTPSFLSRAVTRRAALRGAAALAGTAFAGRALAQVSTIQQVLQQQQGWADGFDLTAPGDAQLTSSAPSLTPRTADYMRGAIQRYQDLAASGGWVYVPDAGLLQIGMVSPVVAVLRQRLIAGGDLNPVGGVTESFDSFVDAAVRRFQMRHGITADGLVGGETLRQLNIPVEVRIRQLQANLARVQALPANLGARHIVVNIPAAAIETVDGAMVYSRHDAVVGKIDRQTPVLDSSIFQTNFNPYWTVPASIVRADLIPLMREDPNYLTENNIRIFNSAGQELSPTAVDWNTNEATSYMFRQDPGEINSLGSVRMNFHNQFGVYLHDTPSKNLFGSDYRFHSSGCVRVQNVREFVSWILRDTPGWSRPEIDAVIASGERVDVNVSSPVPLHMVYVNAWATPEGVVQFRNDIYDRDGLGLVGPTQA